MENGTGTIIGYADGEQPHRGGSAEVGLSARRRGGAAAEEPVCGKLVSILSEFSGSGASAEICMPCVRSRCWIRDHLRQVMPTLPRPAVRLVELVAERIIRAGLHNCWGGPGFLARPNRPAGAASLQAQTAEQ
jgi:hypothetical protein